MPTPILPAAVLLAGRAAVPLSIAALPAPFDLTPDVVRRAGATALVIDLVALASVWRDRAHSRRSKLVWTAVIALLPVLGAVAWFVLGRERRRTDA